MKKIIIAALFVLPLLLLNIKPAKAQKILKIGETEILLQSPVKVHDKIDTLNIDQVIIEDVTIETKVVKQKSRKRRYYPRHIEDFYFGMGLYMKTPEETFLPVDYGNSRDLEIGIKKLYRPVSWFAIGTFFQYKSISYKLSDETLRGEFYDLNVFSPDYFKKEYFRTDNLGIGFLMRLYPLRNSYLEVGAYGDYAFSKRYNVKDLHGNKIKNRDGNIFNPIGAGLQAAVGNDWFSIQARYRLTNMFNKDVIDIEPARFSLGIQIAF